jgi:hypothetical protein
MGDRDGQVWMLPLSELSDPDTYVPCVVLSSRVVMIQPKMSEYRPEKRVPCTVLEVLSLSTGRRSDWYEHTPLEREHGVSRVS